MTVSSEVSKSGPYTGNGVTVDFAYGFRILDASHLRVIRTEGGVETVLTTGFSVSGVGNVSGGTVTFSVAPTSAQQITILRDVPNTQEIDLVNQGAFFAEVVEEGFDLATMRAQQLQEQIDRSVKIPASSDASTLDGLIEDIIRLRDSATQIDTVAGISANVTTVAGIAANVTTAANNSANITTVATDIAAVNTVAADLNEPVSEIETVAGSITNVNTVGTNITNVNTVAGVSGNVTTVAGISGNVTTVAGISANVTTVAGVAPNVTTVAGISANVTTVAGIASDVTTVATNVADITNFSDVYLGPAAANPTLRNDGTALQAGDLYFSTTAGQMRVYDGSAWVAASSAINGTTRRQSFTATSGQTAFTVTGGYDPGFADVYLNGVKLVNGSDVTVTSGTDVVLAVGATAGDSVDVVAYGAFELANHYTIAQTDAAFAPLISPALTGTPTAPTAAAGTNTTQIATTAFVNSEISGDVGVANSALVKTALNAGGTAPIYACRAWVNFNGTGTVAIRASGNVTSITDNGVGDYTINFTTAMPDADYAMVGLANNVLIDDTATRTASACRIQGASYGGSASDGTYNNVAIFR